MLYKIVKFLDKEVFFKVCFITTLAVSKKNFYCCYNKKLFFVNTF